ncbi:MAG: tail fiber protein [Hyphomicrobiales bacterium]
MLNKIKFKISVLSLAAALSAPAIPAYAGTDAYLGEVTMTAASFCPRATLEANGQLLAISTNQALFSLLGTIYGGDGRTSFALPDLRGRSPIHTGSGPELQTYVQGNKGGTESFTLSTQQMPAHNHTAYANGNPSNKGGPAGKLLGSAAEAGVGPFIYHDEGVGDKEMHPAMIGNTGGGQAVSKRSPYLTIKYCIATEGIYPSRS